MTGGQVRNGFYSAGSLKTLPQIKAYMKGGRSVPDGLSTVDYVRSLRED